MRKTLRSSAVLLSLGLASAVAFTTVSIGTIASYAQSPQDPQGPPPYGPGGPRHHGPNAEFETKMLTKRLGLSADQAAKVEPILAAQNEQMKALRPRPGTDTGNPPDFKAIHEQRKAIEDQTKQQLASVLTPDQLAQFDKMHEHRGAGGAGGPGGRGGNWQGRQSNGGNE
jgi:Spy/CpxP family protein refolding chaperone